MNATDKKPPGMAAFLLRAALPDSERYHLLGDYEEYYKDITHRKGRFIAGLWYWMQILTLFPANIWNSTKWSLVMIRNHLKIAVRNIRKQKMYSFINITGLALGMACSIFLLLWVRHQVGFDKFHENANHLYRIQGDIPSPPHGSLRTPNSPYPLGPAIRDNIPEIKNLARWHSSGTLLVRYERKQFYEYQARAVDPSFLRMFSFPLIAGDPGTALDQPHAIILSEEVAHKYFGNEDPIGKTLSINNEYSFSVTGVMQDFPDNSTLQARILVPFDFLKEIGFYHEMWLSNNCYTWVELNNRAEISEVNEKINQIYTANIIEKYSDADGIRMNKLRSERTRYALMPLTDINLFEMNDFYQGKIQTVRTFILLAFVILIIACINYINLSTARSATRAKEVGLRKVVGADRRQIIAQFFGESIFLTSLSMLLSLTVVILILPLFNNLTQENFSLQAVFGSNFFIFIPLIGVVTGISSGSYPALFLSTFLPSRTLKSEVHTGRKSALFRKSLVILQFGLSAVLIIGTLVAYQQYRFMRNKNPGYNKEQTLYITLRSGTHRSYDRLKDEMKRNPYVMHVSGSDNRPTYIVTDWSGADWDGKDPGIDPEIVKCYIDYDFIEAMGIEMVEGRSFSESYSTDATNAFLMNEEMQKMMGTNSAVGKRFSYLNRTGTIVGVMKNFHHRSLAQAIRPLVFVVGSDNLYNMVIRLHAGDISSAITSIKKSWEKINPLFPFEYTFFDEDFADMYQSDEQMSTLFRYAAVFAVIIACIGLFGLASFLAEKRAKEIGIRKTLGATATSISVMLSKKFVKWVLVANIIACPAAYIMMSKWLEDYAYRISIAWWTFALTILTTICIAVLTVGYQSIKSSLANPVKSLRYE